MRKEYGLVARKKRISPVILCGILAFFLVLNILSLSWAADSKRRSGSSHEKKGSEVVLDDSVVYDSIINFLRSVGEDSAPPLGGYAAVGVFLFEFVVSCMSLWLALWLFTGEKKFVVPRYLWFWGALNVYWYGILIFLKGAWMVLEYLVIRLQPDIVGNVMDKFIPAVVIFSLVLYVWLLARTFGLTFLGSWGVLLASHLIYFIVIFFLAIIVFPVGGEVFDTLKDHVGIRPIAYGYLSDVEKITSTSEVFYYIRARVFHL